MKRFETLIMFVVAWSCSLTTGVAQNQRYLAYIDKYKDIAIREMLRYNIPASITLAQGLLESGAGQSELTRKGNNHFGIKCHGWTGATTYHDDDARNECFRAYKNAYESYEDHSKFLVNSKRYERLFRLSHTDYKGWAYGLKACGYATNPQYAASLINIIELYGLHQFDKAKHADKFLVEHAGQVGSGALRPITINNKNYYMKARQGDTFKSLGKEVGISGRKLARYNDRSYKAELHEGDIIYLKKKRSHADKAFRGKPHVVRSGESMYDIAQRYGIRLKSLYKMNHFEPTHQIRVGERIRIY